jgi:excisionase family DNA binding protein
VSTSTPITKLQSEDLSSFAASPNRDDSLDNVVRLLLEVKSGLDDLRAIIVSKRKDFYTTDEIAEIVGRAPYTVRKWVSMGRLKATRVAGSGGHGRLLIERSELARLVGAGRGSEVPAAVIG